MLPENYFFFHKDCLQFRTKNYFFIMRIVYNFVKRKPSMTLRPDRYYIVISRINGWNELCVTQKIKFLKCGRCCIVIVWKYIFLCSPYLNFRDTLIILYVSNYQWKQIMDCVWSIMIYLNLCHSQLIYMKNGTIYTVVNFHFILFLKCTSYIIKLPILILHLLLEYRV